MQEILGIFHFYQQQNHILILWKKNLFSENFLPREHLRPVAAYSKYRDRVKLRGKAPR